ncbi:MAG TPA: hypothetical protein VE981_16895 [Planctomycetota bacterium]|nr:hypothetical protein [Planctomycetota bacterium]
MKLSISKGLAAVLVGGALILLSGLTLMAMLLYAGVKTTMTADDVSVISASLMDLYRRKPVPPEAEVEEQIRALIQASVIGGSLNRDQKPVDRFGTAFRVRHTVDGPLHRVTAASAGPDGRFDTADDISRSATWESPQK